MLSFIINEVENQGNTTSAHFPWTSLNLDTWAKSHPQFPHPLQYSQQELVINIMFPPHDRTAKIIVRHILKAVDRMCPLDDAKVESGTGRITLQVRSD
jgi:hypothetical protein